MPGRYYSPTENLLGQVSQDFGCGVDQVGANHLRLKATIDLK
jgi:hypothetical protein